MLEAFGLSDPGCVRQNNEDCYLISPKDHVYIVADGMGGAQAGEHASKLAVDTVAAGRESKPGPRQSHLHQVTFHIATERVAISEFPARIDEEASRYVVAVCQRKFPVMGMQQIEPRNREFEFVVDGPAQSRVHLDVSGDFRIGKFADIAKVRVESDAVAEVHR